MTTAEISPNSAVNHFLSVSDGCGAVLTGPVLLLRAQHSHKFKFVSR
jgi:hypothetical protein